MPCVTLAGAVVATRELPAVPASEIVEVAQAEEDFDAAPGDRRIETCPATAKTSRLSVQVQGIEDLVFIQVRQPWVWIEKPVQLQWAYIPLHMLETALPPGAPGGSTPWAST